MFGQLFNCLILTRTLLNFPNLKCSDEHGDRPRPLPVISELKKATEIVERKGSPSWDFDVGGFKLSLSI